MSDCDGVDDGEEYRVQVAITKRGDRLEVDFSGTSRQARTCINATALDVKTTVGVAVKYLLDPRGAFTSGLYRNIDIVLPEGTVISALPPDGAVFAYYEQSQVMLSALLRAFAGCAGARAIAGDRGGTDIHNAFGLRPDGTPWVSAAQCGGEVGPFGATRHGDGETQMFSYQANGVATAVEAIEADVPVVMLRHEPLPDSAGPGRHRGGAAMVRDTLWTAPTEHHLMSLRAKRAAGFGVQGGHDGRPGGVWVFDPPDDGRRGRAGHRARGLPRGHAAGRGRRSRDQGPRSRRDATSTPSRRPATRRRPARSCATSTPAAEGGAIRCSATPRRSSATCATGT